MVVFRSAKERERGNDFENSSRIPSIATFFRSAKDDHGGTSGGQVI
jgi:hypothetical protein